MDLEVAYAVILLGPSVRVFVALWPVPFGMGWCFPARGVCPWCARCCRRRARGVPRRRPEEGAESFLLVLSLLAVSSAPLGCCSGSWWMRLASLRPGPRFSLVWPFADLALLVGFLAVSLGLPFSRHFPSCGVPARWRDLRHVVLDICRKKFPILAGSLGVFSDLRSSRSRRMLRGGAYADCAEQWSPGILGSSLPLEWLVEERSHRTVVQEMRVEAPRGGSASTLRVGVWCVHASPRDNRRAKFPTREKGRRPHASHHTTPRACSARTARTHSRRTRVTRYRASSLLGSHPKEACE